MKKETIKKIFRISKKILNIFIGIFIVLFLLVVCLQRFTDNNLSLFGFRMFTVLTGSMEPKYNVGDVLFSKSIAPEDIEVGDAISYLGASGDVANKVVTHEVVAIETDENGEKLFHTKGIANIIEDPIVHESQIYGKVIHKSAVLSFISNTIRTPVGLVVLIIIPVFYIIGSEMLTGLLAREEKRRNRE